MCCVASQCPELQNPTEQELQRGRGPKKGSGGLFWEGWQPFRGGLRHQEGFGDCFGKGDSHLEGAWDSMRLLVIVFLKGWQPFMRGLRHQERFGNCFGKGDSHLKGDWDIRRGLVIVLEGWQPFRGGWRHQEWFGDCFGKGHNHF